MGRAKSADEFFKASGPWRAELAALREILLSTGLTEGIKWGAPCYTLDGANIIGIGGFKSYFGLWFHQGALLRDGKKVLVNAQEGVTKAQRQWRMASAKDIKPAIIKSYVKEAIANAEAGKAIKPDRAKPLVVPPQLKKALSADKTAKAAFEKMSLSRRREYAEYIAEAKQDATKERRIEKIIPMIKAGGGLNDRYR